MPEFDDQHSQAVQPRFSQHTMVQTINNPDGTVSIIHIDTGDVVSPQVVTLADGTQAHVVQTTVGLKSCSFIQKKRNTFTDLKYICINYCLSIC